MGGFLTDAQIRKLEEDAEYDKQAEEWQSNQERKEKDFYTNR
jgi:hypothetical protein